MDVRLHVHGGVDPHAELASLLRWLTDEPEFRGRVVSAPAAAAEKGEMGEVADVLVVALGSGGALTVLVGAVSGWLQHRRSEVSVEIEHPDGTAERICASGRAADVLTETITDRPDAS